MTVADLTAPASDLSVVRPSDLASAGCAAADHIVINELQTGGAAGASDEWIELYNPCSSTVDLSNWRLMYMASASTTEITLLTVMPTADHREQLAGHGYLLIGGPKYSGAMAADYSYASGGLKDTGGAVGLRDASSPAGALDDAVGWGDATNAFVEGGAAAGAPPVSQSVGRHPNGHDGDNNGKDFIVYTTPSPKAPNP
jgi:hypothetical protein